MADDIKGRTYQGTETYGQAFERMSKGQQGYSEAVKSLADELARLNGLSDEQKQWLNDYIEGLDNVRDSWEKINNYIEDISETFEDFTKDITDVRSAFTDIVKDLQSTRQNGTEIVTLFRNFRDLSGDIERSLMIQGGASEKNLDNLQRRAQKLKETYDFKVSQLVGKDETVAEAQEKRQTEYKDLTKDLNQKITEAKANARVLGQNEEEAVYKARARWFKEHGDRVRQLTAELELLNGETGKNVNATLDQANAYKTLGQEIRRESAGLNMLSKFLEKIGISGAKEEYDKYVAANIAARQDKGPGMSKGELLSNLLSPEKIKGIIFTAAIASAVKLWSALKEVSSEVAKLQQNIGKFPYGIAAANTEFATSKQYLETANELAQQFGQNPISFIGKDEIARLAEAKNLLGLSAEQAGNVGIRAKIAGQNMDQYTESIVQGINQGNALNRSAVAHGVALKEVLSTSDDITLSLGNSGEKLGQAIVAAKNLGMSLKDVDNIAGQLLNFESSIENEMKAQLLTGNQMNLARARGLALQNDLEGVAKELGKQGMTAAKFGELNRIQQEAYASALGISREQLGRMLVTQAGLTNLTDAQVKNATGMTIAQLEAASITDRWKVATDKLVQAFTPLLEAVMPVVEGLSKLITGIAGTIGKIFSGVGGGIGPVVKGLVTLTGVVLAARLAFKGLGLVAGKAFGGIGRGIAKALTGVGVGIRGMITSISTIATNPAGWAAVGMVAALAAAIAALGWGIGQATKGLATLVSSFKDLDAGNILMIGPALASMAAGLASFALIPGVLVGIGKLALATKALSTIDSGKVQEASSRATSAVRSSTESGTIQTTAAAAENSKLEKLVGVIANKVSSTLDVNVVGLDYDRLSRNIATYAVGK